MVQSQWCPQREIYDLSAPKGKSLVHRSLEIAFYDGFMFLAEVTCSNHSLRKPKDLILGYQRCSIAKIPNPDQMKPMAVSLKVNPDPHCPPPDVKGSIKFSIIAWKSKAFPKAQPVGSCCALFVRHNEALKPQGLVGTLIKVPAHHSQTFPLLRHHSSRSSRLSLTQLPTIIVAESIQAWKDRLSAATLVSTNNRTSLGRQCGLKHC